MDSCEISIALCHFWGMSGRNAGHGNRGQRSNARVLLYLCGITLSFKVTFRVNVNVRVGVRIRLKVLLTRLTFGVLHAFVFSG